MKLAALPSLPLPPTANSYYRRVGNSMIISARGREYHGIVASTLAFFIVTNRKTLPLSGPLKVTAVFHRPDLRRRDLDNLQKPLWDSLTRAGVYEDDSQIEHFDIRFAPLPLTEKRGTVEITITPLKSPAKTTTKPVKKSTK